MKKRFTLVAVAFLALVALLQLVRILLGWEVAINGVHIPFWASGIALVVAAGLALTVWRENRL
jgi:hypothetical protein